VAGGECEAVAGKGARQGAGSKAGADSQAPLLRVYAQVFQLRDVEKEAAVAQRCRAPAVTTGPGHDVQAEAAREAHSGNDVIHRPRPDDDLGIPLGEKGAGHEVAAQLFVAGRAASHERGIGEEPHREPYAVSRVRGLQTAHEHSPECSQPSAGTSDGGVSWCSQPGRWRQKWTPSK